VREGQGDEPIEILCEEISNAATLILGRAGLGPNNKKKKRICKRILNYLDQGEEHTYLLPDFNTCRDSF
jgi:hypothetical protein